jgi:hypothetical protein
MQDFVQDPDPVRHHVLQTVDALAIVLGLTTDPDRIDRPAVGEHLNAAGRWIAAAQAANDRALHPPREPSDVPGADAGDVERALRRMREG